MYSKWHYVTDDKHDLAFYQRITKLKIQDKEISDPLLKWNKLLLRYTNEWQIKTDLDL